MIELFKNLGTEYSIFIRNYWNDAWGNLSSKKKNLVDLIASGISLKTLKHFKSTYFFILKIILSKF